MLDLGTKSLTYVVMFKDSKALLKSKENNVNLTKQEVGMISLSSL